MLLDVVVPMLTVVAVVWVLRGKFTRMTGNADALASLATALGLAPAVTEQPAGLSSGEHQELEASAVGRAGLAVISALPAARGKVYEGRLDGVRVRLSLVSENRGRTVLTELSAHPDQSWRMGLHMEREHKMDHVLQPGRQARDVITGDEGFDTAVFVQSSNQEAAKHLLRSEALRRAIAAFFGSQGRASISDDGVHLQLPGSESNPVVVRPLLGTMAQLVKEIDAALPGG
jgi:hypothetical protein